MGARFPEANYFVAGSRLRPGLDGGYTIATLRRAQQMAQQAGVHPVLLTFDFWPDYDAVVDEFTRIGLMDGRVSLRNLLQDARRSPGFLRERAVASGSLVETDSDSVVGFEPSTEVDSTGTPWRTAWTDAATGATVYTDLLGLDGRPLLRVPYVSGRADWHRAPIDITVFGDDGMPVGTLAGFGELYRTWVRHVFSTTDGSRTNVVVCESRQVGELLVDLPGDDVRLVHTVHSAHTSAPHRWDSPIDGLWQSWFEVVHRFDAVLWLSQRQREAVERRFGERDNFWVVPHAIEAVPGDRAVARDPNLVVMIGRLVPLKRLDHALRAFQSVREANPLARLVFYGDGPDEQRLRGLTVDLRVQDAVEFRGHQPDAADALSGAAALMLSSTYEGQPLVILEALARGCPVVSYDIDYGPSDMLEHGVSGLLVPDGDIRALGAALGSVLGDHDLQEALSRGALKASERFTPEKTMGRMAELLAQVVSHQRRG
jgi:poly(glycerol-phosphate) alpha-glucosyltransferase